MITVVYIVHTLACLGLILIVLLQTGKGADMGAAFGGSSQTVFGSRGAATFLGKLTTIVAVVFMITSLGLAIISGKGAPPSVMSDTPATQESAAPATPAPTTEVPTAPAAPTPPAAAEKQVPTAPPATAQPSGQGQQ